MTVVNFNGNNITITGKGILNSEDIRKIDFDFTEVEINGFNGISREASWLLDDADTIQLTSEVIDINRCHFHKAKVNHPGMFINKQSFKDLNDLKTSLELQCRCNNDFVYLVYPSEHKHWDGTVVRGYHLSLWEVVDTPTENNKDFFIEVDSIREPVNLKATKVKQILKAIYPVNFGLAKGDLSCFILNNAKDVVIHGDETGSKWLTTEHAASAIASFILDQARDNIIHLGNPDRKWLVNEYNDAPTIEEQRKVDEGNRVYLSMFEQELLLDKEATLKKYGFAIFHNEDLQAICKGHIDDFKIRIYEQDSFGPVVAGFYADGKDYAF